MTTWTITQLERNASDGFVTTVHYNISKEDGEYSASTYGTIGFEQSDSFKPFDQLTETEVVQWVKDKLDEQAVEASLQSQIDAKKNPVSVTGLPW